MSSPYAPVTMAQLGAACLPILARQHPTPMDPTRKLFILAKAAAPGAAVQAYVLLEGGGTTVETQLCKVKLIAPDVLAPVLAQGVTPEEATHELHKKWAAARRAFETDKVLRECDRLSGGLDEDARIRMEHELLHCGPIVFASIAARCRKAAQAYATPAA